MAGTNHQSICSTLHRAVASINANTKLLPVPTPPNTNTSTKHKLFFVVDTNAITIKLLPIPNITVPLSLFQH
jgi:hypothetical protein